MHANQLPDALAVCDESLSLARATHGRSYEIDTERLREAINRRISNGTPGRPDGA